MNDFWYNHLDYKKIWKKETLADRILANLISFKRNKVNRPLFRFKKYRWNRLIDRILMLGLSNNQKAHIISLRQDYRHKAKVIAKKTGIPKKKVMAVLYYYNCWKIKDWKELFYMNVTKQNYWRC